MLALPVASERVESVPGRGLQVIEPGSEIHVIEPADRSGDHIRWEPSRRSLHEQIRRSPVREGLDHGLISVACHVTRVNRLLADAKTNHPSTPDYLTPADRQRRLPAAA